MPQTWCGGLITPIYKSGGRNDPANHRVTCVSSCLGKLFCSILNQRLLEHVMSLNTLHKSQICFLPNNRTADHILHSEHWWISTFIIIRKDLCLLCVSYCKLMLVIVFTTWLKAYLSTLHAQSKLPKSKHYPSVMREVFCLQGCILSPLLFNLYINDLGAAFENTLSDPFFLPNGAKLNSFFYADDLIMLSRSKTGLQNCLDTLYS